MVSRIVVLLEWLFSCKHCILDDFRCGSHLTRILHPWQFQAWRLGRPLPARTTEAQKVGVLSLFCQTARGARVQPSSSSPHLTRTPVHCCRPSPPLPSPTPPPPPGILWTRPREGSGRKTIIPRSSTDPPRRFRSWRTSGYGERKRMWCGDMPVRGPGWEHIWLVSLPLWLEFAGDDSLCLYLLIRTDTDMFAQYNVTSPSGVEEWGDGER